MSVESAIYDILSTASAVTALVGGARSPRVYPRHLPQGKGTPAVIYTQISSVDVDSCAAATGLRTDRVQVVAWDDDPDGARTLAEAVRAALAAATGLHGGSTVHYCKCMDEGDLDHIADAESATRYGKRQDWEIAYTP